MALPTPEFEHDPLELFAQWLEAARASEPNDPNAMALATTDLDGLPDVRMVLLKDFDAEGFVFYTNTRSRKGADLEMNMKAAAVLHWKSLARQVRLRGPVEFVDPVEADAYFASRPRISRIGAWASRQSMPLESDTALNDAVAREAERFGLASVPRPPYWTGYRIKPVTMEFWMAKPHRLHDRLLFRREQSEGPWSIERLYP